MKKGERLFVIITGLSGAGKTQAAHFLEDMGFYCVDNLPPTLIPKFAELCTQARGQFHRVALVVDIRGGDFFDHLFTALGELENAGHDYRIIFLDASDETLVRRFKETRRRHPLATKGLVVESIKLERQRLEELKAQAHHIIDTSSFSTGQLKDELRKVFASQISGDELPVTIVSFGYKYGLPLDIDLIFDVRFLPNPFYIDDLRPLSGCEDEVRHYVFQWPATKEFLNRVTQLLLFLLPYYRKEGKTHLLVGIGCTGGRHRSVAVAQELVRMLGQRHGPVVVEHRDIDRVGVVDA
ncbi:MAG: RNase adapter RapZ [Firmicutes bacterium]|nr:RNase adapter RapZ [Bacillota bacterium]